MCTTTHSIPFYYPRFTVQTRRHDLSMSLSAPSTLKRQKSNSTGNMTLGGSWKNLTVKREQRSSGGGGGGGSAFTLKSQARTLDRKLKHSRKIIDR